MHIYIHVCSATQQTWLLSPTADMCAVSDSIPLVYGASAILALLAACAHVTSRRDGGPTCCGTKGRACSDLPSNL